MNKENKKCLIQGKTVNIPYNNDISLISETKKLNLKRYGVRVCFYFAPSPLLTGTGRRFQSYESYVNKGKFNESLFNKSTLKFLRECKKSGFRTNLLLNDILLGMPYSNQDLKRKMLLIQRYLERLDKLRLIDLITVGNPYLLELINWKRLKYVKAKTSVNFQIKSGKTIELLNNLLEFWISRDILEEIDIQKDLLRDINELKKIKKALKTKVRLSIIINEGCLTGCPYQISHQIHSSTFPPDCLTKYDQDFKFGIAKCKHITVVEPWRFLDSNWILPRHLKNYEGLIDTFKITGRDDSTKTIINTLKAYAFEEYDRLNLNSLISLMKMENWSFPEKSLPKNFDRVIFSNKLTPEYCKKIWGNIVKYNKQWGRCSHIKLKGLVKQKLFKYEGVE